MYLQDWIFPNSLEMSVVILLHHTTIPGHRLPSDGNKALELMGLHDVGPRVSEMDCSGGSVTVVKHGEQSRLGSLEIIARGEKVDKLDGGKNAGHIK